MLPCFKDLLPEFMFCTAFWDEVCAINAVIHAVGLAAYSLSAWFSIGVPRRVPAPRARPTQPSELMTSIVEQWKPVPGYEGLYEVSDQGRVRSLDRKIPTNSGVRFYKGRILIPYFAGIKGYLMVRLSWPDRKKHYIHSLVAEAFYGPRPTGMDCRHLNDNHLDNRAINLCWGTRKQNMEDARRNGRLAVGKRCKWQHRKRNFLGQFQ